MDWILISPIPIGRFRQEQFFLSLSGDTSVSGSLAIRAGSFQQGPHLWLAANSRRETLGGGVIQGIALRRVRPRVHLSGS